MVRLLNEATEVFTPTMFSVAQCECRMPPQRFTTDPNDGSKLQKRANSHKKKKILNYHSCVNKEKHFQTPMHKFDCGQMLCQFRKLKEVVGDKLHWEKIGSSLAWETQVQSFRNFLGPCASHKDDFILFNIAWTRTWVRVSGGLFSLGLSLRMGSGLRPIRALNDIFPWQNVLVPFFRRSLCSPGLSDRRRQWYSGLDVQTGGPERSYQR